MTAWYYSTADRTRLGPVAAMDLADLHNGGQLQPGTLVWREGLPDWKPWHEMMAEVLGIAPAPAAPSRAAFAMPEPALAAATGYDPYALVDRAAPSPYAAPQAALTGRTSVVHGGDVVYAGFWKRVAAYVIDGVIVGIVGFIVQMLVAGVVFGGLAAMQTDPGAMFGTVSGVIGMLVMYLAPMAIAAAYFGLMQASANQASLGKLAVGIKVTDDAGGAISFWRGFGRYFALILSSIPLGIGLFMAAFTDRKRALHDMICSTLVVDRWAFTAHPERQRRELGTVTVVILCLFALLAVAYVGVIVFFVAAVAGAAR